MDARTVSHPWQEIRRLQREVDHLFFDLAPAGRWPLTSEYPPVNLTRNDQGLLLEALCPGADRNSLDVTVVGDSVTLHCERQAEPNVPEERYHRRERPLGSFRRTIAMGDRFDADRASATYTNGILRVQLQKTADAAPKKVPIQS
jgi:HSP20 family protein